MSRLHIGYNYTLVSLLLCIIMVMIRIPPENSQYWSKLMDSFMFPKINAHDHMHTLNQLCHAPTCRFWVHYTLQYSSATASIQTQLWYEVTALHCKQGKLLATLIRMVWYHIIIIVTHKTFQNATSFKMAARRATDGPVFGSLRGCLYNIIVSGVLIHHMHMHRC